MYSWIPDGCRYFISLLEKEGVPHEAAAFQGGHSFGTSQIQEDVLPFFTRVWREQ